MSKMIINIAFRLAFIFVVIGGACLYLLDGIFWRAASLGTISAGSFLCGYWYCILCLYNRENEDMKKINEIQWFSMVIIHKGAGCFEIAGIYSDPKQAEERKESIKMYTWLPVDIYPVPIETDSGCVFSTYVGEVPNYCCHLIQEKETNE